MNALIVIDVQNDYFVGGAWPQFQAAETAARIADCVRVADAAGDLVVAVRHMNAADAAMLAAGSAGAAFYPALAPLLADRPTVDKRAADAFWQTDLARILTAAGVSDIYLCGMMTQNCITHTALSPDAAAWRVHIIVSQNKKDTRQRAADSTHVRQGEITPYIFYLGSLYLFVLAHYKKAA